MHARDDFNTELDEKYIAKCRPKLNQNLQNEVPTKKETSIILGIDDGSTPTEEFIKRSSDGITNQPDENGLIYFGKDDEGFAVYKLVA